MANWVKVEIRGIREVQRANEMLIQIMKPTSKRGQMIKRLTTKAYESAKRFAHVDTGAMKAAIRFDVANDSGRLYLAPSARNPRSKRLVTDYAKYENARGGPHAFMDLTLDKMNQEARSAVQVFLQEIS